jgi:RNA polymerase sporulation-specific sigma factor
MDYSKNTELVRLAKAGDKNALEELCILNGGLVKSIAVRFTGRGCASEDLFQIGNIGLIKAIRSFDESYGTVFSTYAVPLIIGEIKRFLRDDGLIKVSRDTKKLYAELVKKSEELTEKTGEAPSLARLASECGISVEKASYAISAGGNAISLDTPKSEDAPSLENMLGLDTTDGMIERIALRDALSKLPDEQRKIIALRYVKGFSQTKTAKVLGTTQVRISRQEQKIFAFLRAQVG